MSEFYPNREGESEEDTVEVPRRSRGKWRHLGAGIVYRVVDTPRVGLTGNPDVDDGLRAALIAKYGKKDQKAE